jgi:transcriptional regulator with XRE-family HTH domain
MANKKQKNNFLQHVGRRVQQYRRLRGDLTQESLADAAHSNAAYISKIENGNAEGLTVSKLEEIALSLSVSVADLVTADAEDPAKATTCENLFPRLRQRDREIILSIMKRLLQGPERPASR